MKEDKRPAGRAIIRIKDMIMVVVITIPFAFIDIPTALFAGAVCTSLVLLMRVNSQLRPNRRDRDALLSEEKELNVPKGAEVFELAGDVPMDILYTHLSASRSMNIQPKILIIRFRNILQVHLHDAHVLKEVIRTLTERKIRVFIADIDGDLRVQMERYSIGQNISGASIFSNIDDALKRAETILNVQ